MKVSFAPVDGAVYMVNITKSAGDDGQIVIPQVYQDCKHCPEMINSLFKTIEDKGDKAYLCEEGILIRIHRRGTKRLWRGEIAGRGMLDSQKKRQVKLRADDDGQVSISAHGFKHPVTLSVSLTNMDRGFFWGTEHRQQLQHEFTKSGACRHAIKYYETIIH